ncbi:hypothetical protein [uncultured Thiodictyon sp.]|uniref:hypothetical protein n=1 Tax=uncultured Thiodictyon sp. TaxID=1846217 RepID=UPI0025D321DF|nr:hypothetical protein [uncultured Thiodictyon sp.]
MAAHETPTGAPIAHENPGNGHGGGVFPLGGTTTVSDAQINLIAIDRLSHAIESSARRMEVVVYPLLFAFVLLATYGFYLVYSLTKDVHSLAVSVETNMTLLVSNMQSVSGNLAKVSDDINGMTKSVDGMARDVKTLDPMLTSMINMDRSMREMTLNTTVMRDDMASLNRNIGRPMRVMNSFMPW